MRLIPARYGPLVYGLIQALITSGIAAAISTHTTTGFGGEFFSRWCFAWLVAWGAMVPVVIFVSPLIQRCVAVLTRPADLR